jgi:hypothetical protein
MTTGYYRGPVTVNGRLLLLAAGLCSLFSAFNLEILLSALWLALGSVILGGLFLYQSFHGGKAESMGVNNGTTV